MATDKALIDALTAAGYPRSTLGPPSGGITKRGFGDITGGSLVFKVPQGTDTVEGNGASVTHRGDLVMHVVRIVADIPKETTGYLELDGVRHHNSDDGYGNVGVLEVGDFSAKIGLPMRRFVASFTNNSSGDRNVRYWLIGGRFDL